jgi:hypothetical protein
MVVPPVPTLATTLEVISPALNLPVKSEEMPAQTPLEGAAGMVASPMPTLAPTLEVVSPITLNLKGEEMPTHVTTTLECSDSDAAACPTTTNSLKQTNLTTNTGKDSPKTSTRPTKMNAAEMPSRPGMSAEMSTCPGMSTETSTCPMLPPTRSRATVARLPHRLLPHRRVPHVFPALL